MTAKDTVIKAFNNVANYRTPKKGLIFHSDRGVQYASDNFRQLLNQFKTIQSMSRKGNCWDNAVAEPFCKTIKVECLSNHIHVMAFRNIYEDNKVKDARGRFFYLDKKIRRYETERFYECR